MAIQNGLTREAVLPYVAPGQVVVGIDEVGRGAWAGPLLMAAVVLGPAVPPGITDSKLLSAARRTVLARAVKQVAGGIGFGWVPAAELDSVGLAAALRLAARRALERLGCSYDLIIIDGTINFLPGEPVVTLAKADLRIPEVGAASIVAKVARDAYMTRLARADPRYGFERHVGYGTALHARQLALRGPSIHHRHSFRPIMELA